MSVRRGVRGRVAPSVAMRGRAGIGLLCALLCALSTAVLVPARALAVAPPDLQVSAAGLIDASTGQQLYGVNPNAEQPIASTTKIMTALITLEHVKHLDQIFTQNDWYPAADDSQIGLVPGERMSVHDLLIALLLPSADDAAEDLAYNVGGGSIPRFLAMMNAQARELGLTHTHYTTPIGLDTPGNYSTAFDLDKLADYTLAYSAFFRRVVDMPSATLHTGPVGYVVNRNDLVGRVPWINGVKTGHTSGAGYVLVASGTRDGMTLIGSVLGTSSEAARDQNALALLDYGFAEFRIVKPVVAGQVLARPTVKDSPGVRATVVAGSSFERIVSRAYDVRLRVFVPTQLAGPLKRNAVVGYAGVVIGGRTVARVPLLLERALPAISTLTLVGRFIGTWIVFGMAMLVVALAALVLARRRWRVRITSGETLEAG